MDACAERGGGRQITGRYIRTSRYRKRCAVSKTGIGVKEIFYGSYRSRWRSRRQRWDALCLGSSCQQGSQQA